MFIFRSALSFGILAIVTMGMLSRRLQKKTTLPEIDDADDKAMQILLTGATLWKESDGFKVYTKPGDEFDAQEDWFLLEPKEVIYYSNGKITAQVGARIAAFHPEKRKSRPAAIIISGRNFRGQRFAFYYNLSYPD